MDVEYVPVDPDRDAASLVDFLGGEQWEYHSGGPADRATVDARLREGYFAGPAARTFWIQAGGERAGLVRLYDLDDPTPLFDLRIRAAYRRRGLGTGALAWLTEHVFTRFPAVTRIEGTTRQDNRAMRRTFRRCGYVKEAHYRDGWPSGGGIVHDAVGYAILRRDWLTGTTTVPDWDDED